MLIEVDEFQLDLVQFMAKRVEECILTEKPIILQMVYKDGNLRINTLNADMVEKVQGFINGINRSLN